MATLHDSSCAVIKLPALNPRETCTCGAYEQRDNVAEQTRTRAFPNFTTRAYPGRQEPTLPAPYYFISTGARELLARLTNERGLFRASKAANKALHDRALAAGTAAGLVHQGEGLGAYLIVERPGTPAGRDELKGQSMYALARLGSECEVAEHLAREIARKHGPGRWWDIGGCVGYCYDPGDAVPGGDIDGQTYVLLRAYYFHDPVPAKKPLSPYDDLYAERDAAIKECDWQRARAAEKMLIHVIGHAESDRANFKIGMKLTADPVALEPDGTAAMSSAARQGLKHGPDGSGHDGPCDHDCRKCAAERNILNFERDTPLTAPPVSTRAGQLEAIQTLAFDGHITTEYARPLLNEPEAPRVLKFPANIHHAVSAIAPYHGLVAVGGDGRIVSRVGDRDEFLFVVRAPDGRHARGRLPGSIRTASDEVIVDVVTMEMARLALELARPQTVGTFKVCECTDAHLCAEHAVGGKHELHGKHDGVTLRVLLVADEMNRRDGSVADPQFTPAQRAAVSAHWSAQQRAKVEASKTKDRQRVVLDLDPEDL